MDERGTQAPIPTEPVQEGPAGDAPARSGSRTQVQEWLSHPLVLLIAGALISSVLVPSLTRQWQNHEKALQLKSALVEDMNNSVTDFVMAVQFAEVGATSQSQADYDEAYRGWEVKRGQIESRIRVYFPTSAIADEWSSFSRSLTDFYVLSGATQLPARQDIVRRLAANFDDESAQALVARPRDTRDDHYQQYIDAWQDMKDHILSTKDELIMSILEAESALS